MIRNKKVFCKRPPPNENHKREGKIKSSFGPQRFNLRTIYQDYSVTRGINEENSSLSASRNRERKKRLGKIYS